MNLIMLRGEVNQVPLDNMISWWQAIFQITFSFLRNSGWHSGIYFYTFLQQSKPHFKLMKNVILFMQVKQFSTFIWLPPVRKKLYKLGNRRLDFDRLWLFRWLRAGWFPAPCVSVSSTPHCFLYLHHNLFVQYNCLAQWGPQWEPQGISIVRITNNRKEEKQMKKHHKYKNRFKTHRTEEFQNSRLFKTGNRSKWGGPNLPLIYRSDACLQRCIASIVRTYCVTVQWNSRNSTTSSTIATTHDFTFCIMIFFPI